MEAVSKDSNKPTIANAREKGNTIANVSNVKGTFGIKNSGNVIIAINGARITLMNLGSIYTKAKVTATKTYVIVEIPIKCGTCAIKIKIANAFTKPIMTALGMNFITLATLNIPNNTWITPVKTVATNK